MKKNLLALLSIYLAVAFSGCGVNTAITRQVFPVIQNGPLTSTNYASPSRFSDSHDGITIALNYMDRSDLFALAKNNRTAFSADRTLPLLMVFVMTLSNGRTNKLEMDMSKISLTDSLGNSHAPFTSDSFKDTYPNSFDQSYELSFLFDASITTIDTAPLKKKKGKIKPKQALFKGGSIHPRSKVVGIIVFPVVPETASGMTLLIPETTASNREKTTIKKEFRFQMIQTKSRVEEKQR